LVHCLVDLGLECGGALVFVSNSGQRDLQDDQEGLVHIKHQVFQIRVYRRLSVNSRLLKSYQVVKLDDTDSHRLKLLSPEDRLPQDWVFDHLIRDYCHKVN